MKRRNTIALGIALLVAAPLASAAPSGGAWEWQVAPYAWLPSINADMASSAPPVTATGFNRFPDVLDKLDGAFLIHGEGQGDAFGAFTDFIYLGLAETRDRHFLRTESDLDARLFELAAVWSPGEERWRGFEVFAGLRMIDADMTLQVIPNNPAFPRASIHLDETFNDFMLGARYTFAMSDRWALTLRGDGSWGDTEGTWNVSALAQYRTRNGAWAFGWRHLDVELGSGNATLDLAMDGPQIGYAFRF